MILGRTARLTVNGPIHAGDGAAIRDVIIMTKYCFVDAPLLRGVRATLRANEWRAR